MFQIATSFYKGARGFARARIQDGTGHTETFNTPEKGSHNMLETHVNSHCNVTIIGYFYQLDVELMHHARTMITLHLWCYLA